MFGYLWPLQGELKVRELERFKACYCGLCHALGKKYGLAARFVISYELVFLTMLLWEKKDALTMKHGRCVASPCKKKRYCDINEPLSTCAGYNVILTWWKLRDSIRDEGFVKGIPYRLAALFLSKAYKKASKEFSGFDRNVRLQLKELSELEAQPEFSIDHVADKFALILKSIASDADEKHRPLNELLYHLGRWIYIIDACDDYSSDIKANRFNPLALLYPPYDGALPAKSTERLKTTLAHSNNLICSAYELLPENIWSEIIKNMIYMGMPDVCTRVLAGNWNRRLRFNKRIGLTNERPL